MGFAENLRRIRKEKGLSQEALAEMLEVSRQSVSKWEQDEGYPEVEKLLHLSNRLNVSLDSLMGVEIHREGNPGHIGTGTIVITSPHENTVVSCYKVTSSQMMNVGRKSPQYALFGISSGGSAFWGEPTHFLGWYADQEHLSREVQEIQHAIRTGNPFYELKHSAKVTRKWLRLSLEEA